MHCEPKAALSFSRAENFRQLGGLPAAGGKKVKDGIFWRSGALCELETPEDRAKFDSLGIRVICDLRSSNERRAQPDPDFAGAARHDISAIVDENGKEVNFDPHSFLTMTDEALEQLWRNLMVYYRNLPFANEAYRAMFREIKKNNLPLLFHCSAGKDRTGIAAALILLALGADKETIMADFLFTNSCRPNAVRDYEKSYAPMVARNPKLKDCLQAMSGVEAQNLENALGEIEKRYPHVNDYFEQELGMTAADLQAMRAACLE